ncbi:RNA-directed DNA polymerase, eukaryota, reverse transcriptase zinc-binding domain protein [Tanacetum coccineum]
MKTKKAPQNHDEPVIVLEQGTLNFEGDPVLVGCVKDFKTLPNLHNFCYSEGFSGFKISYLGSFKVLLEFDSLQSCKKFRTHKAINSWFSSLTHWTPHFEVHDRDVWIDVEANKYSMRLCVKTKFRHLIAKSFKVILKGKVYVVRAKEVTGWVPEFGEENSTQSEDVSDNTNVERNTNEPTNGDAYEAHSAENTQEPLNEPSRDPFGQPRFPPGFTPQTSDHPENENVKETKMVSFDVFVVRAFWGIMLFDFATSSARGRSGEGTWLANNSDLLFISVYSPQELSLKRALWTYMTGIINRWHGEVIVMGDFNEVPILLKESHADYGPTPFCLYHSWFLEDDFHSVIEDSWNNDGVSAPNSMTLLKNKLKYQRFDKGDCLPDDLSKRTAFLHWICAPFEANFPRHLDYEQSSDLEGEVTNEEIKRAVWDCGSDKSPGLDGFTFDIFKKFWSIVGGDVINAVKEFFNSSSFLKGCNSSFIALILKVLDAKYLNEF